MKFYTVLRETEDWENVTSDNFWENKEFKHFNCFRGNQLKLDKMKFNLSLWDNFSMNFFQFRQALKDIAQRYHLTSPLTLHDALEIKDRQIVFLPIDDDDLVHPDVLEMLEIAFRDSNVDCVDFLSWCHSTTKGNEQYYVENWDNWKTSNGNPLVSSNAYAIRSTCATHNLLINHLLYSDNIRLNRVGVNIPRWGLRFIHPASMYECQRSTVSLLENTDRYLRPTDLDWAVDAIEEVFNLTASLKKNRNLLL